MHTRETPPGRPPSEFDNCWQPLAKELGIKVVPTFKILKQGKIVKEVTGAKFDNLVIAIESVRSAS
jgi:thioredoxin 1